MKKIKKIKVKPKFGLFLKILGVILCIILGIFLFYFKQVNDLKRLGYSEKAAKNILFSFQKDYIMSVGENASLNAAFESEDFIVDNLDMYRKIDFVSQEHFIQNINQLVKVGYNVSDMNIIFAHGDDAAVTRFSKREKVRYLEEFFSVDYAKLDLYDRYVKYSDDTGEDENVTVLFVNLDMDLPDYSDSKLVDKFSIDMLVNKHHHLSEDFVPDDLITIDSEYASSDDIQCSHIAFNAYKKMSDAASKEGYKIVINSAYRSYNDQVELSDLYLKSYGQEYVNKYVAKPGYSEHQTGLAFDIGSRNVNVFGNSQEYQWMQDHAYEYGFIHRFTKSYEFITGFRSEPWHYRYVGVDIATYMKENNMSFEEYWALFLDK